ncbi:MAG: tripartite tricarboxylate transporter substrate binding protein [Ottowia sp.]|uniref:tripartite tricarboxylate transporter substrate binding protein n=1 Tax=Ottowia sp. TaxID=1898956 RepID=UPI003C7557DC
MCTQIPRIASGPWVSRLIGLSCAAILAMGSIAVRADTFPSKPVRLIVPFAAGGTSDVVTRLIGDELAKTWKVPVIVDNRPGAGGNIGSDMVARATPDGYTLLMGTVATHGINASLYSRLPYNPVKDFEPVSLVASTPSLLMINPKLPVNSVAELVAYAKANPGKLNYGSAGNGSSHHLAGQLFESLAGAQMVHVPYKGTAAAITDLVAGQIQLTFDTLPSALPHVRAGTLRALAVTSRERYPTLPQLPTVASTVPNYEIESWYGVLAPAGTPGTIVTKLSTDIAAIVQQPGIREKLLNQGARAIGSTPQQFGVHIHSELKKWAAVVKDSGARIE